MCVMLYNICSLFILTTYPIIDSFLANASCFSASKDRDFWSELTMIEV